MSANRRKEIREELSPTLVSRIMMVEKCSALASEARIIDASISGLKMIINRKDLVPNDLRSSLSLDELINTDVNFHFEAMSLDLSAKIVRTKALGKGLHEIALDYTDEAPDYWREALLDMLPKADS